MKKRKLLLRLLICPFVLGLFLTTNMYYAINNFILFIRYGSEWITLTKSDTKTIYGIYKKLQEMDSLKDDK